MFDVVSITRVTEIPDAPPEIFTALQEPLGLKLEPVRALLRKTDLEGS